MFKRNCVVKYVDNFGVEHAAKVEAESLFEAAVRGLHRLDSSFWAEDDVFERMSVTVEIYGEPTTHTVMIQKLKHWIKSHGRHPREERTDCVGLGHSRGGVARSCMWNGRPVYRGVLNQPHIENTRG
jgi:hypothetical protein